MTATAPPTPKRLADMPDHARTWVYKTGRGLSHAEQNLVRERGAAFTRSWAAHGAPLDATVDVIHDRFVVVAVDEEQAMASGCSIDKSVGFIKQLEYDLNLMLTDRMIVVYEVDNEVMSCRLQDLPHLLKEGVLNGETLVYDDLVSTMSDLRTRFRVPLMSTWLQRFLG